MQNYFLYLMSKENICYNVKLIFIGKNINILEVNNLRNKKIKI